MEKLKKNVMKWKNDIAQSVHEALSSDGANYDLEGNDSRNVFSQFRLKLRLFSTNYISNCSIRSRISTYQVFFLSIALQTLGSNYLKMYCEAVKWRAWLAQA